MAKAKKEKVKEKEQKDQKEQKGQKGSGFSAKEVIIMAVVVIICSTAGFGLSSLFAKPDTPDTPEEKTVDTEQTDSDQQDTPDYKNTWFYELDPVIANLDVPGATRYVRATLTLEISIELDELEGRALIDHKKPRLINWLTVHLASLTLEDVRGERNLRKIQDYTLDAFNEELFGDRQPMIQKILLKEFPIQ